MLCHENFVIKPSKKNVKTFLAKIQATIKKFRPAKTIFLLRKLNPMIRGWAMYHRMDYSKDTFQYVDHRIWQMVWRWATRRHRNKNKQWVKDRYFKRHQRRDWALFDYDEYGNLVTLIWAAQIPIKRHAMIKGTANPYDSADELYYQRNPNTFLILFLSFFYLTPDSSEKPTLCR